MNLPSRPASRFVGRLLSFAVILFGILASSTPSAFAQLDNSQCLKCHADPAMASMSPTALAGMVRIPQGQEPVLRDPAQIAGLVIRPEELAASAHGGLRCVDCHPGIDRLPHAQRLATLSCSDCHQQVQRALAAGMHRPGDEADGRHRPACLDCHGNPHEVNAVRSPRTYERARAEAEACMKCHANDPGGDHAASYAENVHGKGLFEKGLGMSATCVDCHGAHTVLPATDPESRIYPTRVPDTCGKCHEGIKEKFYTSVHGQHLAAGDLKAATCTSCHQSHGIKAVGPEFMHAIVAECSTCHAKLGESYLASYHGKATTLGSNQTAVCSSCHGAHDILPPSDPRSRVAPANLQKTCGTCHQNVNANFVKYLPHARITDRAANPAVFWTWVVMTTLLLSVLAVFVPHGLLWFQRSLVDRLRNPRGFHAAPAGTRYIRRFNGVHRFTHFLIIVSFMGLVITGFPLKYSNTAWAQGIAAWLGGSHVLGMLHRTCALISFTYAGIHFAFLIWFFWKDCPRPRWKYVIGPDSLLFSLKDLKDFWAMVKWFFWLGPRPKFDRWTYYEKFDYFGEIWGTFLIGGTGLIMWFPTLFTRWLPGWVLNCAMVVHSIEALLAASVIFLVHFFNTHIRPEKFPIDMVMLTGSMSEPEMEEERPAEYERLKETGQLESRVVDPIPLPWRIFGGVVGMMAFTLGMILIALALRTELSQLFVGR